VGYRHWKQRARQRAQPHSALPAAECPARCETPEPDPQQAAEQVHAVLDRLAPRDRLVLTLFYLEGSSVAQIAELTGWSQTMVKVQTHRARGRLRKLMEGMGITEWD
jgi:RNA polymerase sigma-70 factor, ECF subfamily